MIAVHLHRHDHIVGGGKIADSCILFLIRELCSSVVMVTRPLPPLSAVRAFEIAARYESLRQAADALGVTPSAVSHQIKALEHWVGAPLFVRVGREVRLSSLGRELAQEVGRAFDGLSTAFATARHAAAQTTLRVTSLPLFTQYWLIPRLGKFEKAHPGISIIIDTTSRLADFENDAVDVAIRNSAKPAGALSARKLMDLKAVPLCTPTVASKIKRPEDLSKATLIHLSVGSEGWPQWLARSGLAGLRGRSNLTVDTMPAAIEAAVAGHGVMLGLHPLIWEAPSVRSLVVPFHQPLMAAGAYYVVHRKSDRVRQSVRLFVGWIAKEMHRDMKRFRAVRLPRFDGGLPSKAD